MEFQPAADGSNGYEEHAEIFMRARNSSIGPDVMRDWAGQFATGAEILELGCGHGVISEVLIQAGLTLFAVDASPTLLAAFRKRFPHVRTENASAQDADFFSRAFDGIVAWGLMFLLEKSVQERLIARVGGALNPGGKFVFTAPYDSVEWVDGITGKFSWGLGADTYKQLLNEAGLKVLPGQIDAGDNYYFYAVRDQGQ